MKRKSYIKIILSILGAYTCFVSAEEALIVHNKMGVHSIISLTEIDSLYFDANGDTLLVGSNSTALRFPINTLDSLSFGETQDTVSIRYDDSLASVNNPFLLKDIDVSISGADVTINSKTTTKNIVYCLSGYSTNGQFKLYSNTSTIMVLTDLQLTNDNGPAINIQSSKRATVTTATGTSNTLIDGTTYASSEEDQKGAFFSEGQLKFSGTGSLTVTGNYSHGICSDDCIEIESGKIILSSAIKDGIHAKDHFNMEGGELTITASGDAIDCEDGKIKIEGGSITSTVATADTKGLKCDSTLTVSGGRVFLTVSGNQAKGFKSGGIMDLSGGDITINTSGAAVLSTADSGFNPSFCTAIKCDADITISGSTLTITTTGDGGKGISSDKTITIASGIVSITNSGNGATYTNSLGVVDAYTGSGIEADSAINMLGGEVTVIASGAGAKGISADGAAVFGSASSSPIVKVTNTGTRILLSGTANYATADYIEPKGIKSDGMLTINNGEFTVSTNQQDGEGFDCDSIFTLNNGTVTVTASGNASKGINASSSLTINGGTITVNTSGGTVLETSGSGYDPSYCSAIKSSSNIIINGGNIEITATGAGNKGITADSSIAVQNATIAITATGAGSTYKNTSNTTDTYFCTAMKADKNAAIQSGSITIKETGSASKGISADGTLTVGSANNSPVVNITTDGAGILLTSTGGQNADYSIAKGLKGATALIINNGDITIQSNGKNGNSGGGEALESFALTINGGTIHLTAVDDCISVTKGGETMKDSDGSSLVITDGYVVANSSIGDAIDSNGTINMTGGTVIAHGPTSQPEEGLDFNGSATVTGGFLMASGANSSMNKALSTSSTQCNFYVLSNSQIAAGTLFAIQDANGNNVVTIKPIRAYYSIIYTSSLLVKGSTYKLYTGGTCSGTLKDGIYTGGSYSGGTLKKTITTSTSSTVNQVTF